MIDTIDVFFEFASPYSYLAAQELPALAARHGRPLQWRPIELAKVWAAQGVLEAYRAVRRVKAAYVMRRPRGGRPKPKLYAVSIAAGCNPGASCRASAEPMRAGSGRTLLAGGLAQALC